MKRLTNGMPVLLIAMGMTACTGNPEQRALDLMEAVATTAEAHRGKCGAMARALDELLTERLDEIQSVRTIRAGKSDADRSELERRYRPKREAAVTRTARAMRGCATTRELARALSRL